IEQSLKNAEKVFDILEVSSLEELLAITDDEIRENYQEELHSTLFHLGTQQRVADGDLVPINGYQKLLEGCAKDIDIMIGHTDGEKDYHASDWDNYPNPIKDNKYILKTMINDQILSSFSASGISKKRTCPSPVENIP
ncbi:hypothetical protein, partial [Alistipes putredinis]|uniref:hypothetical protein n=2 Tax=Alistipes putredinis TaxID=28117 RepID=UPI003A8F57AF